MTRPMLTRHSGDHFRLANTAFLPSFTAKRSFPTFFRVHLGPEAIECLPRLRPLLHFRNILQINGEDAGSAALTALVGAPAKIVAVSTSDVATDALVEFGRNRGIEDRLHVYSSVELSDTARLARIVADEFGSDGLEVVIDDVLKNLETGLRLFEALFPRVAPGGSYVVRRWSWDHFVLDDMLADVEESGPSIEQLRADAAQGIETAKGRTLEAILPRLVEAARVRPEVVAGVTASKHWLEVRRGPARVDPSTFRLPEP